MISNGREEDFDDSFLFSFKSDGGAYRVCVSNDMNRVANKVVQVDIRSSAKVTSENPIKISSDPKKVEQTRQAKDEAKGSEVGPLIASLSDPCTTSAAAHMLSLFPSRRGRRRWRCSRRVSAG